MSSARNGGVWWTEGVDGSVIALVWVSDPSGECRSREVLVRERTKASLKEALLGLGVHGVKFRSQSKMIREEHVHAIEGSASDVIWRDFGKPGPWAAWVDGDWNVQ